MSNKRQRGDINMSQAASSSSSSAYAGQGGAGAFAGAVVGVPNSIKRTLLYADTYALNSGVTTAYTQVFRLNSLYDPDFTGVGHQPRYFDQLAAMFNRYRVDEVHLEVTLSTTSNVGAVCVINSANNTGGIGVLSGLELPFCSAPVTVQADQSKTMRYRVDLAKLTGVTKKHYQSDDRYQSDVGDNPAEALGLSISMVAADASTTGIVVNATCRLAFKSTFFDRIAVGGS